MKALGHVFKYGDNVDTDVIIPARYLNSFDPQELASHAMVDIDPNLPGRPGAGRYYRSEKELLAADLPEHAPLCLKTAGVSCLSQIHFARIFYRNAINIGLPIIECPEAEGIDAEIRLRLILTVDVYIIVPRVLSSRDRHSHYAGTGSLQVAWLITSTAKRTNSI